MISPSVEFAQTKVFYEIICDIGVRPVLNLFADNDGERGEKKTAVNISLCTVFKKKYSFVLSLDAIEIKFVVVNAAVVHQRND